MYQVRYKENTGFTDWESATLNDLFNEGGLNILAEIESTFFIPELIIYGMKKYGEIHSTVDAEYRWIKS